MSAIVTIGIDLAKNVFAVHGADVTGKSALIGKARRLGNRLLADDQTTEDERKCVVAAGEKVIHGRCLAALRQFCCLTNESKPPAEGRSA